MIKALLFDLDDTLLGNEMGTFIPAYFKRLLAHMPASTDPARLLPALLAGTQAMRTQSDPAHTLLEAFDESFSSLSGLPMAEWLPIFTHFFQTDFADLRPLTTFRPEARTVLEWAASAGYTLAITTSPLFPHIAIAERLRWAGLADLPLARVTSFDNSRFAKPCPEYFAEVLAHLDLRPEEALVIGNDPLDDLEPAAALGIPHFWIAPPGTPLPTANANPVGVGDLNDFLMWAKNNLKDYQPSPSPATGLTAQLAGNLAALLSEFDNPTAEQWLARPSPDEWSLTELACHLRDVCTEVHWPRLNAILTEANPFIAAADTDPWAVQRHYQSQSGLSALATFTATHKTMIGLLSSQPVEAWNRPARHTIFGPITLAEIVSIMVDHDRLHLKQIKTIKARLGSVVPA